GDVGQDARGRRGPDLDVAEGQRLAADARPGETRACDGNRLRVLRRRTVRRHEGDEDVTRRRGAERGGGALAGAFAEHRLVDGRRREDDVRDGDVHRCGRGAVVGGVARDGGQRGRSVGPRRGGPRHLIWRGGHLGADLRYAVEELHTGDADVVVRRRRHEHVARYGAGGRRGQRHARRDLIGEHRYVDHAHGLADRVLNLIGEVVVADEAGSRRVGVRTASANRSAVGARRRDRDDRQRRRAGIVREQRGGGEADRRRDCLQRVGHSDREPVVGRRRRRYKAAWHEQELRWRLRRESERNSQYAEKQ